MNTLFFVPIGTMAAPSRVVVSTRVGWTIRRWRNWVSLRSRLTPTCGGRSRHGGVTGTCLTRDPLVPDQVLPPLPPLVLGGGVRRELARGRSGPPTTRRGLTRVLTMGRGWDQSPPICPPPRTPYIPRDSSPRPRHAASPRRVITTGHTLQ